MDQFLQEKIAYIEAQLTRADEILSPIHKDTRLSNVNACICLSLNALDELKEELAERQKYASVGEE